MLAGGMVDGTVKIFNPARMCGKQPGEPLLASLEKHTGGVRALEFNPGMPHLLASGAGESDVIITDLSNPAKPSVYSPGAKSNGPAAR